MVCFEKCSVQGNENFLSEKRNIKLNVSYYVNSYYFCSLCAKKQKKRHIGAYKFLTSYGRRHGHRYCEIPLISFLELYNTEHNLHNSKVKIHTLHKKQDLAMACNFQTHLYRHLHTTNYKICSLSNLFGRQSSCCYIKIRQLSLPFARERLRRRQYKNCSREYHTFKWSYTH